MRNLLILLSMLFICACTPTVPLESGEIEYAAGNYLEAAAIFNQYSSNNGPRRYQATYHEGMCYLKLNDCKKATDKFSKVIKFSNDRTLRARAIASKATCLMMGSNYVAAEEQYQLLLDKYPEAFPKEEALAGLAAARAKQGNYQGEMLARNKMRESLSAQTPSKPLPTGKIYRVRLKNTFKIKDLALLEMKKLDSAGIENALFRARAVGGDYFVIQIGAFRNKTAAYERGQDAVDLGWAVTIN